MQLMRPSLRQDDFDMEKNVILEEIAMYKDQPQFEVMDQGRALHFGAHPCGNSVLGTNESISNLSADQMRDYFSRRYAPNNLVLACCGNFDFERLCRLTEEKCSHWKPAEATRSLAPFPGTFEKKSVQNPNLVRQHICLLSPSVSMQDPQRYAASLLSMMIGDDTGSHYYWALVDPALAETAVMQCESMDGIGAFYSYLCCNPDDTEKVLGTVDALFQDIQHKGFSQGELDTARNKVLSAMTLRSEQPMGRLVTLGFNWVYNKHYCSVAQEVSLVKSVTLNTVCRLLEDLRPEKFTQFSLGPKQLA
jgi:predicted Zn-dependent peptidase